MKRIATSGLLIVALLCQSCAYHIGGMSGSASLTYPNFRVTATGVEGTATTTKFFGLGGLARQGLVADAKKDLLTKYKLKENQALANVTVDFKTSFIFIMSTRRCIVTADIVEFKN